MLQIKMEIPEWLIERQTPAQLAVRQPKEGFADKTLRHVLSFIKGTLFNEGISSKKGFMQHIEPRVKALSLIGLIVVLSFLKDARAISLFLVLSIILYLCSRIPIMLYLKKLMPVVLVTIFISLPAALNLIVKGDAVFTLFSLSRDYTIGPWYIQKEIALTRQGIHSVLMLNLRVLTSISLAMLIALTTKPESMVKAISSLLPGPFNLIVSISYRYIFFLLKRVEQSIMALKSRSLGRISTKGQQRWVASRMGFLFSLSYRLSEDLYKAMEARGYKGETKVIDIFRITAMDIIWSVFCIIFSAVILWKFSS